MNYTPISEREEQIASYSVHSHLGPGLVEPIYEVCFCHELTKRGFQWRRQVDVPIVYDGITFDEGLRLDVLVEGKVICELLLHSGGGDSDTKKSHENSVKE